nr:SEC14-like protein 2 isoform X4 [Parasteatoda tepidariorum]
MKNAEAMLRKHISWRKEYNIDTLLTDYQLPEVLELYAPISVLGQDKEGSPVIFAGVGKVDEKGILKSTKMIDIFKLNLFRTETALDMLKHENEKNGKLDTKVVYVYDFDQLTFPMATNRTVVEMLITWISMYQDNYPERIKAVYVINAQFYFTLLFSALKFIVASAVLKKVHIYGTEGWREVLQEIISSDVLPAFLGGKRTDPDGNPLCKSFITWFLIIPTVGCFLKKFITKLQFYHRKKPKAKAIKRDYHYSLFFTFEEETILTMLLKQY